MKRWDEEKGILTGIQTARQELDDSKVVGLVPDVASKPWNHEIFDNFCGRIKGFLGDCLRIGLR